MKESVVDDLRAFGKHGRVLLRTAAARLAENPLADTRQLKTLRPNPVAPRELRLLGRYRVLFTVHEAEAFFEFIQRMPVRGLNSAHRG